jgi:hypothetical protein
VPRSQLNKVLQRKDAYRGVFADNPASERVLADLATFCRAFKTTHVIADPTGSAQLEGRRQVWLRIQEHIHADDLYIRKLIEKQQESDDE